MVRRPRRLLSTAAFAAIVAVAWTATPAGVHAAELGDVRVTSHIGQPLTADIELTTLDDPAVPVGVRIAGPDIYSGAGLALPPVLSSVTLSVTRRDGRQFIHVTSLRPVDADHVHLYLDLVERGQHAVRLATVWLTPDPNPPAPVVAASPVPVVAALSAPPVVPARPRSAVAAPMPTPMPTRRAHAESADPAPAVHAKVEPAHAAAAKATPSPVAAAPATDARAAAPAIAAPAGSKTLRPSIVPKLPSLHPAPAPADASAAACSRQADDAPSCSALNNKNAELRAQLASLEEKVKRLQAKLGVAPAAAAPGTAVLAKLPAPAHPEGGALAVQAVHAAKAALPAKAAAIEAPELAPKSPLPEAPKEAVQPPPQKALKPIIPPGPKPISSIKTLVPRKATAPDDDSLPLGWIAAAAAVLALAGATATLVARRRKTRRAGDLKSNGILGKLKQRFSRRAPAGEGAPATPAPAAVPEHAEPSLE